MYHSIGWILLCFIVLVQSEVPTTDDSVLLDSGTSTPIQANASLISSTNSTMTIKNYKQDIGTCLCDITYNKCDMGCCCDPDCGSLRSLFRGKCKRASWVMDPMPVCSMYFANLKNESGLVNLYKKDGSGVCVVSVNSPIEGFFYSSPTPLITESSFMEMYTFSKLYSYAASSVNNDISYLKARSYLYGDYIQAIYSVAGNSIKGTLGVPSNSLSQYCNDADPVQFLVESDIQCSRVLDKSGSDACQSGTPLSYDYYVGKNKASVAFIQNPDPSSTFNTSMNFNILSESNLPSWNGNTSICSNIVTGVNYLLGYDGNGVLTSVGISFTYANVKNVGQIENGKEPAIMTQRFTVKYDSGTINVKSTADAPIIYSKSGNPGYQLGQPLLGATFNATSKAMSYIPNPLYSLSLPKNVYNPTSNSFGCASASDLTRRHIVGFGQDALTECTVRYSLADLRNSTSCQAIGADIFNMQTVTASQIKFIGIFGNASIYNIGDWVSIVNNSALYDATSNAQTNACENVLTEFNVFVLYSDFGSKQNPQSGIVGVRYELKLGSLQFQCSHAGECLQDSSLIQQDFTIKSSITFTKVKGVDPMMLVPPPPKLTPPLPGDIFYPFQLN